MISEFFEGYEIREPCRKKIPFSRWDLYAKKQYCPKIKVTDWWYHREGYPKDNDDIVKAAYNRLGTSEEDKYHWMSETKQAMEEGRGDPLWVAFTNREKPLRLLNLLNYHITEKPRKDLRTEEVKAILPSMLRDPLTLRYTTTNQDHYKVHVQLY